MKHNDSNKSGLIDVIFGRPNIIIHIKLTCYPAVLIQTINENLEKQPRDTEH